MNCAVRQMLRRKSRRAEGGTGAYKWMTHPVGLPQYSQEFGPPRFFGKKTLLQCVIHIKMLRIRGKSKNEPR